MSSILIDVPAGAVSAFYFIVLDLFASTLLDLVLARAVCSMYFRRINFGFGLRIQSADIPGVTNYLLGRFLTIPNVIVVIVKLIFLACILIIELGITSATISTKTPANRMATFEFNASDEIWDPNNHHAVSRRREFVRRCSTFDKETGVITYYHIAFNLSHGEELENEIINNGNSPVFQVNDTTIECLAPGKVRDEDISPMIEVIGCSQLVDTVCTNETQLIRPVDLEKVKSRTEISQVGVLNAGPYELSFSQITVTDDEVTDIFPEYADSQYTDPQLTCTWTNIGLITDLQFRQLWNCLLIVYQGSSTIIDRWEYGGKQMVRKFPGPVFKGKLDYGAFQRAYNLQNLRISLNWQFFSSIIVTNAVIYEPREWSITVLSNTKSVTRVSASTAILASLLVIFSVTTRLIVACSIGKDERPQLNTLDGLSSVAREESQPSGRSYVKGRETILGLSYHDNNQLHFGPVLAAKNCVKRSSNQGVQC